MLPMRDYQKRAVAWGLENDMGYFAVDMGLGKTRIILELAKRRKQVLLVVAPKRVAQHTWPQQILEWAPELTYTVLHGRNKEECYLLNRDVYIINYDGIPWLQKMFAKYGRRRLMNSMLVLDESSAVKSHSSNRSKLTHKMRAMFRQCYCLSASPAPNGMQDLFMQYLILDHGESLGTGYTKFMNTYFTVAPSRVVRPKNKNVVHEIERRISARTFRLDASDYLKLPDFIDNKIELHLPEKLRDMYTRLEEEFVLQLKQGTITAVSAATLSMKLRQLIQGAMYIEGGYEVIHEIKLDALEQVLQELNGNPALVAIQFKSEFDMIKKRFGNVPAIVGGQGSNATLDAWNAGDIPALFVHPASVSHGVNLQAGGHNIIWYAPTWNFEHYYQLNGRLRRSGQTKTVVRTFLTMANTKEDDIIKAINSKGATQQTLLDALRAHTL